MNAPTISYQGLLAGDAYLQSHTEEFDYFGKVVPGLHVEFVKSLLQEVFRASGISLQMLPRTSSGDPAKPEQPHQENPR